MFGYIVLFLLEEHSVGPMGRVWVVVTGRTQKSLSSVFGSLRSERNKVLVYGPCLPGFTPTNKGQFIGGCQFTYGLGVDFDFTHVICMDICIYVCMFVCMGVYITVYIVVVPPVSGSSFV